MLGHVLYMLFTCDLFYLCVVHVVYMLFKCCNMYVRIIICYLCVVTCCYLHVVHVVHVALLVIGCLVWQNTSYSNNGESASLATLYPVLLWAPPQVGEC